MLKFHWAGGGYCVGQWGGGDGKRGEELINVELQDILEPHIKVQVYHTALLST